MCRMLEEVEVLLVLRRQVLVRGEAIAEFLEGELWGLGIGDWGLGIGKQIRLAQVVIQIWCYLLELVESKVRSLPSSIIVAYGGGILADTN